MIVECTLRGPVDAGVISPNAKCPLCNRKFTAKQALIRIQVDLTTVGIHRRCMELLLLASPEDEPVMQSKVDEYLESLGYSKVG